MSLEAGEGGSIQPRLATRALTSPTRCPNDDAHDPDGYPRLTLIDPEILDSCAVSHIVASSRERQCFLDVVNCPSGEQERGPANLHTHILGARMRGILGALYRLNAS